MKAKYTAIIMLGAVMLLLLAASSIAGVRDLKYPPLNKIEIPQPDKETLDNGMTIYMLEDHTLPRIVISVRMNKCGSYLEPPQKTGLAEMAGSLMRTGGTKNMAGDDIDEALESIGASVETGIGSVSGSAGANALSEYKEMIIKTLADVLRNPIFDEDKIELEKTQQKSAIARRNDEPLPLAIREFRKVIYGDNSPYARNTEYATIDAVTRDDLIKFHSMAVQPNNIQLAVIGDFDKAEILALLNKYFGDWARGQVDLPEAPDVAYTPQAGVYYAEKEDLNQSTVLMGHIGGKMGDPDYAATIMMNAILGEGFGSRMFSNLRSKEGLAYATGGYYTFNYDYPGYFISYILTKGETTAEAIKGMKTQINSMQTDPPTDREMKMAKEGWLNSFVFNFDTKGEVIGRMMTYDYYGFSPEYLQQIKQQVEEIKPEDILEVAKRKLDPEHLRILVVGNDSLFDEPLSQFGEVVDLDISIPGPAEEEFAASDEQLKSGMATLAKVVEKCGGDNNFGKVKTVTTAAKITISSPQGSFNADVKVVEVRPDKSAQIITLPMGEQRQVFSGNSGWVSAMGQSQALGANDISEFKKDQERDLISVFASIGNPYYSVAEKGMEDFTGKSVKRLDFVTESGTQFTMYVDPTTNLPAGMKYMGQTPAGPGETVLVFKAFKEFSGLTMPANSVRSAGGTDLEIEIVSMDINGTIDESLFVKPDGI